MKMAGSNILTRRQLKKMTNEQLIEFAMKLQNNMINKQTELINDNKEFREKLSIIDSKFDELKKENEVLKSKVSVAEKTLLTLSMNYKNINEKVIEMKRNMHRLEQYSRHKCIEIAGIPSAITNDLLKEYVFLIFEKLDVVLEVMDIVACKRLGKTNRVIVKLLNCKDSQYNLEKKYKLRNIALYNHDESENSNSRKIFINQSFCLYYRKLYGLVMDLSNEGLTDSFWISNGTIKIWESSQSKPISITHESDLQF